MKAWMMKKVTVYFTSTLPLLFSDTLPVDSSTVGDYGKSFVKTRV
jgi:hypothetical protein